MCKDDKIFQPSFDHIPQHDVLGFGMYYSVTYTVPYIGRSVGINQTPVSHQADNAPVAIGACFSVYT